MQFINQQLTVPAADFDDKKVFAFRRERPKSQTYMSKGDCKGQLDSNCLLTTKLQKNHRKKYEIENNRKTDSYT